jgi:outer membrane protein assembly factor BamB
LTVAFFIAAITLASALTATVQAAGTDWWPMFRHDPNHTGTSNSTGPATNNTLWTYATGASVLSSPSIIDGFVYVGSYDRKVYCLNAATGELRWSYTAYEAVFSSPAVVDGRSRGFGEYSNGHVYCLNASTTCQFKLSIQLADGRSSACIPPPSLVGWSMLAVIMGWSIA